MTSTTPPPYTSVSLTLRPSRVVIVIDGDEHWSYWARRALCRASRVWGGSDFVIVPHQDGRVDRTLLRGCQAYDPDFVVTYNPTIEDLERLSPGSLRIPDANGTVLEGEAREHAFEELRTREATSKQRNAARKEIASVCSVYRLRRHETITSLGDKESGHFTDARDIPEAWTGAVLACPPHWGGLAGAAAALRLGMAAPPEHGAAEPELDQTTRHRLTELLLGRIPATPPDGFIWHPTSAQSVDPQALPSAFERTRAQLTPILSTYGDQTGILVLGDTAEDFALACLWQRTFGTAYWLPSVLGIAGPELPAALAWSVTDIRVALDQSSTTLGITSISCSREDLTAARERLDAARPLFAMWVPEDGSDDGKEPPFEPTPTTALVVMPGSELSWRQPVLVSLAVADRWETALPVPVTVDATGTTIMAAQLPAPTLAGTPLSDVAGLNWQVDVRWSEGRAVRRRGTPGNELLADPAAFPATVARSSRHGTSYQVSRFDFVSAGILPEHRLARPALRDLSLAAWIAATCTQQNRTAKPSDAGLRAAILTAMIGTRQGYVDFFGGPLLPALRAMRPKGSSTRDAYPAGDGVRIASGEGVLIFDGVCARMPTRTRKEVRTRLDAALRAGVLRRGLVLRCEVCGRVQFQTADRIGQRWTCLRCDAANDLNQTAWHHPEDEPRWYYDLHPAGRELLDQHGDTVALLSAHLRRSAKGRTYDEVEEIEIRSEGKSKPDVEVDLVAYFDDLLTIAECKSSTANLSGSKLDAEVTKKCMAAAILRADQLMFAKEGPEWPESQRERIRNTVANFSGWGPTGPPKVLVVAGLETADPQEQVLPATDQPGPAARQPPADQNRPTSDG